MVAGRTANNLISVAVCMMFCVPGGPTPGDSFVPIDSFISPKRRLGSLFCAPIAAVRPPVAGVPVDLEYMIPAVLACASAGAHALARP